MEKTVITDPNITSYTFNWKISRFDVICPEECSKFDQISSGRFKVKRDDGVVTEWSVTIEGLSEFISIFVKFEYATNSDGTFHRQKVCSQINASIGSNEKNRFVKPTAEHAFSLGDDSDWGWYEFLSIEDLYQSRETLLQYNTLHVRVQMQILGKHSTSLTLLSLSQSEETVNTLEVLSADLGKIFNKENNSDVEIICENKTFYAHKLILSARSKVFSAMLEAEMNETATSKIILTDIDATTCHAILLYIYTGKVEKSDTISYNELIYGAEKYDLSELKKYCFEQLCKIVTVETIGNLAVTAEVYNADEKTRMPIKEYCQRNFAELMKDTALKSLIISHPKAFL